MAKIFDLDRFSKRKRGKSSSWNSTDSSDPGKGKVLPIDMGKRVKGSGWPVSTTHTSLNVGAAFLLVIGILCGLYLSGSDEKTARLNPKAESQQQPSGTPQISAPAHALAKPSPIVPADKVQAQGTMMAGATAPMAVPNPPAAPASRYLPTRYQATHKKMFGGCSGQLELTTAGLHFTCRQDDLDFPVYAIAKAHKDGVELKSGEKYHFTIANHTKDQVEAIFISWLSRVQQSPQTERAAAF